MSDADLRLRAGTASPSGSKDATRAPRGPTRLAGILTGTQLLTPTGYRPVETLRRGDQVATLIGRGPFFVPIAWVGRRRASLATTARPDPNAPVRIRRDAIAEGMPARDILLAPDHAIYLDGALYLADVLVNRATILRESRHGTVDYWGVQLERHNILVAENLAIESLLNGSASAYTEVGTPPLRVVHSAGIPEAAPASAASTDFPARIMMSVRWFRRRLFARGSPVTSAASAPPAPLREPPAPSLQALRPNTAPARGLVDVQSEARAVLESLAGIAQKQDIRLEIAIQADLTVRLDRDEFRDAIAALVTHAIHAVSGGRVLLGAMRHAGRIQIAVMDEGSGDDPSLQSAQLRPIAEFAARQGGSLEIDSRPNEGTTLLLRLPEAAPPR